MAIKREEKEKWEGVKFENFPFLKEKECKSSIIWVFGGKEYSLFDTSWCGNVYTGRTRFITPKISKREIISRLWDLTLMREKVTQRVKIRDDNNNVIVKCNITERNYFKVEESTSKIPAHYVRVVGGYFKYTLSGRGRDRNFHQIVQNEDYAVIAETSNTCHSGRYGSSASIALAPSPIEVEDEGIE